jgi:hypothetical protein
MQIHKGKYRLEDRSLYFDVIDDLDFKNNGNCFYFRGDNGFGKTSFLEKLIIPALGIENVQYLYIGQDIRTQLYTLRALLSVQGYKVSGKDEIELLKLWVRHDQSARVFILDEFDKYFPDYRFIFDWSRSFIRTYIIVTHRSYQPSDEIAQEHRFCHVKFELIDFDGRHKNIRVKKEQRWQL